MRFLVALVLAVSTTWAHCEPSVLFYNSQTHHSLIAERADEVRPIASITKLMTALVALDTGFALDRSVKLNNRWGSVLPVKPYTRRELLTATLVKSDNSAAETLAEDFPGGRAEFLREMNERARRLGMLNTHFDDASGLIATNVSTIRDLQILLAESLKYPLIRELTTTQQAEILVPGKKRAVKVVVNNTNSPLLGNFASSTVLGKTGLTSRAGWCVAMVLEEQGQQFYVIVLGAKTKAERTKIVERIVHVNLRSN